MQHLVLDERPLDFLGYRIYHSHRLLRKSSVKRIKTKIKAFHKKYSEGTADKAEIMRCISSWVAHANHADTAGLKSYLLSQPFTKGN